MSGINTDPVGEKYRKMASKAPLMVTISGIRGVYGDSLTPQIVASFVASFADWNTKKLGRRPNFVVGRDSRVSGPEVRDVVLHVLEACGIDVQYIGLVATPTVQLMVKLTKSDGGIVITSSHNPIPWNGLKFVAETSLFLGPVACGEVYGQGQTPEYQTIGAKLAAEVASPTVRDLEKDLALGKEANQTHIDSLVALSYVCRDKVAARKLKVCIDTVNGAGGPVMALLCRQFGCEVVELSTEPTGLFSHPPEPLPAHLTALCEGVVKHGADIGIATDPDVDRCVIVDEKGVCIGEEYTLALAYQLFLESAGQPGPMVVNLSSSRACHDMARAKGNEFFYSPVGEINVAERMIKVKAVFGGEGNGGVMLPDLHIGRDAPCAGALILSLMGNHTDKTLSQLKGMLPQYQIVKQKIDIAGIPIDSVIAEVSQEYEAKDGFTVDRQDGIRIDGPDWWVHLRKSNTEPIIRVIAEAQTFEDGEKICDEFREKLLKK